MLSRGSVRLAGWQLADPVQPVTRDHPPRRSGTLESYAGSFGDEWVRKGGGRGPLHSGAKWYDLRVILHPEAKT